MNLNQLSVAERVELMGELWDSLRPVARELPLTTEHDLEVRRRIELLDSGRMSSRPWNDVSQELMNRA